MGYEENSFLRSLNTEVPQGSGPGPFCLQSPLRGPGPGPEWYHLLSCRSVLFIGGHLPHSSFSHWIVISNYSFNLFSFLQINMISPNSTQTIFICSLHPYDLIARLSSQLLSPQTSELSLIPCCLSNPHPVHQQNTFYLDLQYRSKIQLFSIISTARS